MRHFYMVTNEKKDPDYQITGQIQEMFQKRGASCKVGKDVTGLTGDTECILVLGGDGTLLRAAGDTFGKNIPLLGVNLGNLGFMAEVETGNIEQAVDALMRDEYQIEERMMLDGSLLLGADDSGQQTQTIQAHALNDVVVTRQGPLRIVSYDVYVNGRYLTRYEADGVIIATPTGSTGYSMSAGGPIVEPVAQLLLMTPICPHSLSPRTIILSPEDTIEIRIGAGGKQDRIEAGVNFDGNAAYGLKAKDSILVKRSGHKTRFLRIHQSGFLENLHRKMNK
ncbi:MAG: NAD(+)/NADH kinase [Lachnospiraceae bacterium]|jgi:NAD+ kinase|nr:NAD(+)/NADH kinase [Lachnospiraceae bacterium]